MQDLRKDASSADVRREVDAMELTPVNAFVTRAILRSLRGRALPCEAFERLARGSPFGACSIAPEGVGLEVRLHK